MKRLLLSALVIFFAGLAVFRASTAFFSDTEKSEANNMTAGRLDLLVNGVNNPEAVVFFDDLKPGDRKEFEKTLFVDFNPAKIFLHLSELITDQGDQTEPEDLEESQNQPAWDINQYMTYDLIDGQGGSIFGEPVTLADAVSCYIPLGTIPGATEVKIKQVFGFDPAVTNWAQGDRLSFTEEFLALQVNDPEIPLTGTGRVWDPELKKCVEVQPTPTPTPLACEPGWATGYLDVNQLNRKDNLDVLADRSDPADALVAESSGSQYDDPVITGSFFSLGFGGSIVIQFPTLIPNKSGSDFRIYEVTGGTFYPPEIVKVEASSNGSDYTEISTGITRDGYVDLGSLSEAKYLRFTDISNSSLFEDTADAYDLDGVYATCGTD